MAAPWTPHLLAINKSHFNCCLTNQLAPMIVCCWSIASLKTGTRGAIQELSNPIVGTGSSDLLWMLVVPRADAKRELAKTWQVFLLSRQFVLRSLSECDQPLIVTLKCRIISLLRTGDIHFLTKFVFSFAFKRVLFVDISVANPRPTPVLIYCIKQLADGI